MGNGVNSVRSTCAEFHPGARDTNLGDVKKTSCLCDPTIRSIRANVSRDTKYARTHNIRGRLSSSMQLISRPKHSQWQIFSCLLASQHHWSNIIQYIPVLHLSREKCRPAVCWHLLTLLARFATQQSASLGAHWVMGLATEADRADESFPLRRVLRVRS